MNKPPKCPNCQSDLKCIGEGFGLIGIDDHSYYHVEKVLHNGRIIEQPKFTGTLSVSYGYRPIYVCSCRDVCINQENVVKY